MVEAPPAVVEIVGRATVVDGDTLRIAGPPVRLFGVDAPELGQTCTEAGRQTACGVRARVWLQARVGRREIRCEREDVDRYGRVVATCRVDGRDLGRDMVAAGWAVAFTRYSVRYLPQELTARAARRGLWAMRFTRPADYRRGTSSPAQAAPPSCVIKGNISRRGQRIYHLPGDRDYAATAISPGRGERWFCSETEARAAGWRAAR